MINIGLIKYGEGHLFDNSPKDAPEKLWNYFNTLYFYCKEYDFYIEEQISVKEYTNPKHIDSWPYILIGGDHSITYYSVKRFSKDIYYLSLDAHFDCLNEEFHHGSFNYYLMKEGYTPHFFGVRAYDKKEYELCKNLIVDPYSIKNKKLYLSVDIDITNIFNLTWEPYGIRYEELDKIVRYLIQNNEIIGIDIVESTPKFYETIICSAHLLRTIICELIKKSKKYI